MISLLRKNACSRNSIKLIQTVRCKSTAFANLNVPFPMNKNMQREMDQFMRVFPDVVKQLTAFENDTQVLQTVAKYFEKALEHNIPHGNKVRGLSSIMVYKDLMGEDRLTSEKIRQAQLLGWCIQLLQGAYIVADDIIDGSEFRDIKNCWYKMKDVQMFAVNDVIMLKNACFTLLKQSFGQLACYSHMCESLHDASMASCMGNILDFKMTKADVSTYSMQKYRCMVDYKTSHFAVYTPTILAMMLAGYEDANLFKSIKDTCYEMAYFYQVQNDFLDLLGDALNKYGTDIQDGKCTWPVVTAMELGSDEQRQILKHCYGKNDPESINKVKQLYSDLELPEVYRGHAENAYNSAKHRIDLVSDDKIQRMLTNSLNRIFGRT